MKELLEIIEIGEIKIVSLIQLPRKVHEKLLYSLTTYSTLIKID